MISEKLSECFQTQNQQQPIINFDDHSRENASEHLDLCKMKSVLDEQSQLKYEQQSQTDGPTSEKAIETEQSNRQVTKKVDKVIFFAIVDEQRMAKRKKNSFLFLNTFDNFFY